LATAQPGVEAEELPDVDVAYGDELGETARALDAVQAR
jgi:hypothetical protein